MRSIAVVVGTRPEAVKLAPVVHAIAASDWARPVLIASGQHRGLLAEALGSFDLEPDLNLNLMRPGQSLEALTARAIEGLADAFREMRPDLVLVQGDTTTAFAGALAAFYRKIPVGHVEAGLRTGDLHAPWPEEANRRLIAPLASLHFAPTARAAANLRGEGIDPSSIFETGNTAVDALRIVRARARAAPNWSLPEPQADGPIILVTAHRRENFGAPLRAISEAVADLANRFPAARFVVPIHPNPEASRTIRKILANRDDPRLSAGNVALIEPLDYEGFVALMAASTLILTDSGGIQEEAPGLGVPVLVLRETTERPEAVEAGWARLVGHDRPRIRSVASRLIADPQARAAMTASANPFGDGHAAERIVLICRVRIAEPAVIPDLVTN